MLWLPKQKQLSPSLLSTAAPVLKHGPLWQDGSFFYFALGRHALAEGLRALGVGPGDYVLFPSFICRDLLASLAYLGARPLYYPVSSDFSVDSCLLLEAQRGSLAQPERLRGVVAVNYFGFPQALEPFRAFCNKFHLPLIEDNAHGFLSQTPEASWLGCRGDIGVFSLRKTVRLKNGGLLWLNPHSRFLKQDLSSSLSPLPWGSEKGLGIKVLAQTYMSPRVQRQMAQGIRWLRRMRYGHAILPSPPHAEVHMPELAPMARSGLGRLARIDVQAEVARRRRCFLWVESLLKPIPGLEPVFHSLPPLVAPYMYPFILYDSQAMERVGKVLAAHALECFPWPELPDVVAGQGDLPWFYKHTYGVSFLV